MSIILVVDDERTGRELVQAFLHGRGHMVLEASDPAEGFRKAVSSRPDLIVSDVVMPEMDGYEFVRKIRSDARIAETRVILWTAAYDAEGRSGALAEALGVSRVLSKPCEPEVFLEAVGEALLRSPTTRVSQTTDEFDRDHARLLADKLYEQVSELHAANERLAQSENQYRMLFEGNPLPMWIVDMHSLQFLAVNAAAIRHYGYTREEFLAANISDIAPDLSAAELRAAEGETPVHCLRHRKKNGEEIDVESFRVATQFGGRAAKLSMVQDVTERSRAERALRESERQLHDLATRLRSAQEEERTRVARHLHDELGQSLTAMKMTCIGITNRLPKGERSLLERMQLCVKLVDEMIGTVRRLATELRPALLDLGIGAAIEWQASEFQSRSEIECVIDVPEDDEPMDANCATQAFRIFQEALTNVARHAGATRVDISLKRNESDIFLQVHDNGKGISEADLKRLTSIGLLGMKERAALVGGELSIEGSPGSGTTVRFRAPLRRGPDARPSDLEVLSKRVAR